MRFLFSKPKLSPGGPAIFIDRDGVINKRLPGDYVLCWSQFVFVPGICDALKRLALLKLPLIVISNQSAVGRGLLDRRTLEVITCKMHRKLRHHGASILAVYYCPHTPQDRCLCRKPKPDLLLQAAEDFRVDLSRSIFIGDSDADVTAARAAHCQPVLFGIGLNACSSSTTWKSGIPTARRSTQLFGVVTRLLEKGMPDAIRDKQAPGHRLKSRMFTGSCIAPPRPEQCEPPTKSRRTRE